MCCVLIGQFRGSFRPCHLSTWSRVRWFRLTFDVVLVTTGMCSCGLKRLRVAVRVDDGTPGTKSPGVACGMCECAGVLFIDT